LSLCQLPNTQLNDRVNCLVVWERNNDYKNDDYNCKRGSMSSAPLLFWTSKSLLLELYIIEA
jgi:hypothetical protein